MFYFHILSLIFFFKLFFVLLLFLFFINLPKITKKDESADTKYPKGWTADWVQSTPMD